MPIHAFRGRAAFLLVLLICACATKSTTSAPDVATVAAPVLGVATEMVLVAGDSSIPAFDNATDYLRDTALRNGLPPAQLHQLSPRGAAAHGHATARLTTILETIAGLRPAANGSCFIFLTSHGSEDHGLYLQDDENDDLMPSALKRALATGCDSVPTVVVVSACYAGQFLTSDIERPNRIIITAARADRSSFGCEAGATFTFFDECLLGSLAGAKDWQMVAERTRGCVGVRERQIDALPSEPQTFFGSAVANLPVQDVLAGTAKPGDTGFDASGERFSATQIPLRQSDRKRLQKDLKAFAKAADPKALALVPNGLVVWADRAAAGTDDLDKIGDLALQRCEFLSGGACVLYARDSSVIQLLPSGLPPFHPMLLVRQGRLRPDDVPFLKGHDRSEVEDYASRQGPKAMALDPTGGTMGLGFGATLAGARDDALAQCESAGNDCVIYAEGDEIVLGWRG